MMAPLFRSLRVGFVLAGIVLAQESHQVGFHGDSSTLEARIGSFSAEAEALFGFAKSRRPSAATCKTFPTDATWPPESEWSLLNTTTNGALIKTVPIAAPCYPGPLQNQARCSTITSQWGTSNLHMNDPSSMMSPLWQGRTCLPPTIFRAPNNTCTLGGYPSYVLNASTVAQIQLAVNFARNKDIRLVVKNTGHDFSGKSGGAGGLSIWTHGLKGIEFLKEYVQDGGGWKGSAFRVGSGVQAWEIYEAASKVGMVVVGGEGKTVGVFGGFILGGGHSPLSSILGMGADHVLSFSVVLPSGEFVTASATSNPDLFFALRGGGGSTFGVVTSLIVKAYPDFPVTTTTFSLAPSGGVSSANFWAGVRAYFNYLIPHSNAGIYSYFFAFPGPRVQFQPVFAPNLTIAQTKALFDPFVADLAKLNITINPQYTSHPNFLSAWTARFPQEGVGGFQLVGSRLFPRSSWLNQTSLDATFAEWRKSIEAGLLTINFNIAPRYAGPGEDTTAVLPAWRETVLHAIQIGSVTGRETDAQLRAARKLMDDRQKAWQDVSPGAGSYMGESDREEVGFQQSFFGKHYARLDKIKREVDPWDVLWARTAVGSERWQVRRSDGGVIGDENGPLCRV